MDARNVVLTHFSARYPKIITMKDKATDAETEGEREKTPLEAYRGNVAIAFDHADMKVADMWKIKYYLDALKSSYSQTVVEDGDEGDVAKDVAAAAQRMRLGRSPSRRSRPGSQRCHLSQPRRRALRTAERRVARGRVQG